MFWSEFSGESSKMTYSIVSMIEKMDLLPLALQSKLSYAPFLFLFRRGSKKKVKSKIQSKSIAKIMNFM